MSPRAVAVVAMLQLSVAACGNGGVTEGDALDLGSNEFTVCVPSAHSVNTVGTVLMTNVSEDVVTIEDVSLVGATTLDLVHAEVAPREGLQVTGTWPPDGIKPRPSSEPAAQATLAPGEERALWLGVRGTDAEGTGTAESFEVKYEIDGQLFSQAGTIGIAVTDMECDDFQSP